MPKDYEHDRELQDIIASRLYEYMTVKNPMSYDKCAEAMNDYSKTHKIDFHTSNPAITNYVGRGKTPRPARHSFLDVFSRTFGVSMDYLYGLTSNHTIDISARAAADYLGVSNKTVEKLKRIFDIAEGGHLLSVFEGFMQDEKFNWLFHEIRNAYLFTLFPNDTKYLEISDEMYDRMKIDKKNRKYDREVRLNDGFESAVFRSHQNAAAGIDNAIEVIKNGGLKK